MNKIVYIVVVFLCVSCKNNTQNKEIENRVIELEKEIAELKGEEYTPSRTVEKTSFSSTDLREYFAYKNKTKTLVSAHRAGGNYDGYPENCLATMQYLHTKYPNFIYEIDVTKTKDNFLILLHDDTLERTTSGSGRVEDKTFKELKEYNLVDNFRNNTSYKIPLFEQVLQWAVNNNVILFVDIKRAVRYEQIIEAITAENAWSNCVLITYSVGQVRKLHQMAPDAVLSVSIRNEDEKERFESLNIPYSNVIAFTGTRNSSDELYTAIHKSGSLNILGTLGNIDKQAQRRGAKIYREYEKRGVDIFATDFPLEVIDALDL